MNNTRSHQGWHCGVGRHQNQKVDTEIAQGRDRTTGTAIFNRVVRAALASRMLTVNERW
jgi:hypothetical protein